MFQQIETSEQNLAERWAAVLCDWLEREREIERARQTKRNWDGLKIEKLSIIIHFVHSNNNGCNEPQAGPQ